jgi:hypothetical protein
MVLTVRPVRRRPPAAAIAAAGLGLVSCALPALFLLIGVALSDPDGLEQAGWIDVALPAVLVCGLVAGGVVLLLGRSWLALAGAAGVLIALMVAARVLGGWGGGPFFFLGWVAPVLTVVLGSLPVVRRWVADRRAERAG